MSTQHLDFEIQWEGERGDGPVAIPIDGPALTTALGRVLDPRSLRVSDRGIFTHEWGADVMERPCLVQFEPGEDFDTGSPKGTLWVQVAKYTWENRSPRLMRLHFSTLTQGGGPGASAAVNSPISPKALELVAFPAAQRMEWRDDQGVRLAYRWPAEAKPHFFPLRTPAGRELTADAPRDHLWHHGLCIGFTAVACEAAGLRPYAYWGEPCQGFLWHEEPRLIAGPVWNGLRQRITYATHEGTPVFDLDFEAKHSAVERKWDWLDLKLKFSAREHEVQLGTEYGFLKARMNLSMTNGRIVDSTGGEANNGYRSLTPSDWVGFEGSVDGATTGLLLLNHDSNPGPKPSADGSCAQRDFHADEGDLFGWIGLNPLREAPLALKPGKPLAFCVRAVCADRPLSDKFCRFQWDTFQSNPVIVGLPL